MFEPLMKLPEVAQELKVSVPTLRTWARQGHLNVVRLPGGTLRVTRAEVERLSNPQAGG